MSIEMDFLKDFRVANDSAELRERVIDLLYSDLFGAVNRQDCLEHWYNLMKKHFNDDNKVWSQVPDINLDGNKGDPLLVCTANDFAANLSPLTTALFQYPCFGHDTPVWLSPEEMNADLFDNDKVWRVMLVSQDPLRGRGNAGELLLSSPFGMHSADYRKKDGKDMMEIIQAVWNLAKEHQRHVVFYLTDYNKFFVLNGKKSMKTIKQAGNRNAEKIFQQILNNEIELFNPSLIVTIGDPATAALLPKFNTSQAKALIRYSPQTYNIDGTIRNIYLLPMYHISGACGHRFSKYKDVNKDGRYSSWHEWYADEIVKNLKVTSS
jgi:hypothetical protein